MTKYLNRLGDFTFDVEMLGAFEIGASKFKDACDLIRKSMESAFVIPWEIGISYGVSPEKKLGVLGAEYMNAVGVTTVKVKRPVKAGQLVTSEDVEL